MKDSIIAIDPGAEHCGVAVFVDGRCVMTTERRPTDLYDSLGVWGSQHGSSKLQFDVMVVEDFKLDPKRMASLAHSRLETVKVIGVLEERCRRDGTTFVLQPASIKRATAAQAKRRLPKLTSKGSGGHAKDAELHGWHYLWTLK
jgi:hypothetical protein